VVTAVVTLITSATALPYFGWQAAGWSACLAMLAQIIVTTVLLRQSFKVTDVWPRVAHFVLLPLGTGILTAMALRYLLGQRLSDQTPHWWFVGAAYGMAAGIIFFVVVAVSRIGPYGAVCWRDLRVVVSRFVPARLT